MLKGNEVLEVDDVLYVEADEESLAAAWDEHADMMAEDGELEGVRLLAVTDEEADGLYERRMGDDEDEGEEIDEQETATGWRLTREKDGSTVDIVGNWTAGTWSSARGTGTYERHGDDMVFKEADGTVLDVVNADEECWAKAWLF